MLESIVDSSPQLVVFVGPMMSGKSSAMLAMLDRFKYQSKRVEVFKPKIENRYSMSDVVTHTGWKIPATLVETGADVLKHMLDMPEPPHVVAVDELFMIPGISDVLIWLYRRGFTVVATSLNLSSSCKQFSEVSKILPWATRIECLSSVCSVCGADAHFTHKKIDGDDEIVVGGGESYEPRCWRCHSMSRLEE